MVVKKSKVNKENKKDKKDTAYMGDREGQQDERQTRERK